MTKERADEIRKMISKIPKLYLKQGKLSKALTPDKRWDVVFDSEGGKTYQFCHFHEPQNTAAAASLDRYGMNVNYIEAGNFIVDAKSTIEELLQSLGV